MILEKIMQIGEDVSSVKTTIEQHGGDIKTIKNDVIIIKSDNQANYTRFIKEKEEIYSKVNPMWDDFQTRQKHREENRTGFKRIFFSTTERIIIWIGGGFVTFLLAGHVISDFVKEFFTGK